MNMKTMTKSCTCLCSLPLRPNRYSWLVYVFSEKHAHLLSHIQTHNKLFFMDVVCEWMRACAIVHCKAQTISAVFEWIWFWFDSIRVSVHVHVQSCLSTRRYITIIPFCQWQFYTIRSRERHALFFAIVSLVLFVFVFVFCSVARIFYYFSFVLCDERVCDKRQACTS